MKRAFWIAVDLTRDALASVSFVFLTVFLGLWLPFQAGLLDGGISRLITAPGMRHSLVMNASWPSLAVLGLHAHVFFPRRLKRELEPMLAAPVADGEIVLGLALPVLAVMAIVPPLTFALNMLGYRLTAGCLPSGLGAELARLWLAMPVACLWLSAFSIDAAFRSTDQGSYLLRVAAGYLVLSALDAILFTLSFTGFPRLVVPAMALALAGGAAALWIVGLRVDRECLVERV